LLRLQGHRYRKQYLQTKKNFDKTADYVHLTYDERKAVVEELARTVSAWRFSRLFAECVDKIHFNPSHPSNTRQSAAEQAFEQVVSRFEKFLQSIGSGSESQSFGLLIHDNNATVAGKLTRLMKDFHREGRSGRASGTSSKPRYLSAANSPAWCRLPTCAHMLFDDTSRREKPSCSRTSSKGLTEKALQLSASGISRDNRATARFVSPTTEKKTER